MFEVIFVVNIGNIKLEGENARKNKPSDLVIEDVALSHKSLSY